MKQIPGGAPVHAPDSAGLSLADLNRVTQAADASLSANTRRMYRQFAEDFAGWLAARGLAAQDETVAAWLAERFEDGWRRQPSARSRGRRDWTIHGAKWRGGSWRGWSARAAAIGVAGVSGHSLRVGAAQSLSARGAALQELMTAGRWRSATTAAQYVAGERAARGAVAVLFEGR